MITEELMQMSDEAILIQSKQIESWIMIIRGHKVMLSNHFAELYGVSTGNLNKAVFRNRDRFPEDFMFQLTQAEFENLIFQFGRSSWGGVRKLPYAFTETGIASSCFALLATTYGAYSTDPFTDMRSGWSQAFFVFNGLFLLISVPRKPVPLEPAGEVDEGD
jgi:hypothetical protein